MRARSLISSMSVLLSIASLSSCSVKEDRDNCPCFLDIALVRQAQELFSENKAWCGVWNGSNGVFSEVFSPVVGNDGLLTCRFPKRHTASIILSNIAQQDNRITVHAGSQMEKVYVSRQDVDCPGDYARADFDSFNKMYVNVTFYLNTEAYQYRDNLSITVDGPYDGLSLPSLSPHEGKFSYTSGFEGKGYVAVRIPPQSGPGLKVAIRLNDGPPATIDLYRTMLDAGFDWKGMALKDFETTLGLNAVSSIIEIVDWNLVDIESVTY